MTPDEFKSLRTVMGWTKVEMASRLGYRSHTSISDIEKGKIAIHDRDVRWLRRVSAPLVKYPTAASITA